jgi:hypothetical protein
MDVGYSDKSLSDKLGLKPGMQALFVDPPAGYLAGLDTMGIELLKQLTKDFDFAQIFATDRDKLQFLLQALRPLMHGRSFIWVSWPKKTAPSSMYTLLNNVSEDTIRDLALPMGLVDVKVCAVDDTWSGLKLVLRKELR